MYNDTRFIIQNYVPTDVRAVFQQTRPKNILIVEHKQISFDVIEHYVARIRRTALQDHLPLLMLLLILI